MFKADKSRNFCRNEMAKLKKSPRIRISPVKLPKVPLRLTAAGIQVIEQHTE